MFACTVRVFDDDEVLAGSKDNFSFIVTAFGI